MSVPSAPLRILIVDDEPLQCCMASGVLARAGWRAEAVESGEAALAALLAEPADCVLLDLHMAGLDGLATLTALRALPRGASVPVIAFTSTRLHDPAALIAHGFDDYLAKPCTPDELIAAAGRWTERPSLDVADRLRGALGHAQIDGLLYRFRLLLEEALGGAGEEDAAGLAHRVAGVAGTLGFSALGGMWLDRSEGRGDAQALRRATRLVIHELADLRDTAA